MQFRDTDREHHGSVVAIDGEAGTRARLRHSRLHLLATISDSTPISLSVLTSKVAEDRELTEVVLNIAAMEIGAPDLRLEGALVVLGAPRLRQVLRLLLSSVPPTTDKAESGCNRTKIEIPTEVHR